MHHRHALAAIREALTDTPVTLIHGPRQVGKTTLIRDLLSQDFRYVTLDSAATLAAASADPEGFLAGLDDADRRPGRYLLTGSANVLALPQVSESGRHRRGSARATAASRYQAHRAAVAALAG